MADVTTVARVILRPNGEIHIVTRRLYSVLACANSLLEFLSDPFDFIERGCEKYTNTITSTNRKKALLHEIPGLTLMSVDSDKKISCDFPELFHSLLTLDFSEDGNKPINIQTYLYSTEIPDEKSFLLRFYIDFCNQKKQEFKFLKSLNLREEVQFAIIREIINTYFEDELPQPEQHEDLAKTINNAESVQFLKAAPSNPKDEWILLSEYAQRHDMDHQYVRKLVNEGHLQGHKDSRGWFWVNKNDTPKKVDLRAGRKNERVKKEHINLPLNATGPEKVMARCREFKFFSEEIASYIRELEELKFYEENSYHEVVFNNKKAIIVDVGVEYVSSDGVSNRELMAQGRAPHIPERNKEEYVWDLHHIGQKASSPLATIPSYIHNGKGFSSIFHSGTKDPELDRPEFAAQKATFWMTYLEEFDKANQKFSKIPFSNSKHSKYKDK